MQNKSSKKTNIEKSTFNERKYHTSREWHTENKEKKTRTNPLQRIIHFFKHRSGKSTPYSVKEISIYTVKAFFIMGIASKPHLDASVRILIFICLFSVTLYILRQAKIRKIINW